MDPKSTGYRQVEEESRGSEALLRPFIENAPAAVAMFDREMCYVAFSRQWLSDYRLGDRDLLGLSHYEVFPEISEGTKAIHRRGLAGEVVRRDEDPFERADGTVQWLRWVVLPWYLANGRVGGIVIFSDDVTERRSAEHEREAVVRLLSLLNAPTGLQELIHGVTDLVRETLGFEAVGIRLRAGADYPYFETRGFPEEFVRAEMSLCRRDGLDLPVRDSRGDPILECMCGNVLSGRFAPGKPFFTARGSFWTNCTTELLATTSNADRMARTRNRCHGEGYESVGLFALRAGGTTVGLLQVNDRSRGRFTPATLVLLERLADSLAIGIAHRLVVAERETLERQRQLALDAARLGWWRYDPVTRDASWDEGYRRIFGISGYARPNDEVLAELIHPEDLPALRAGVEAALDPADPRPFATEYRIRRPDGQTRRIEAHGIVTFEGDGRGRRPVSFVGTVQDVTERRRAEEELREAHAQLRGFVDSSVVGILIARADGRVLEANDYYLDLVGYTREELARGEVDWRAITPPEWLPATERALADLRERGTCTPYEKEYFRRDGSRVAVLIADALLPGAQERIAAFAVDISARREAERALALVNRRLEELIEAVKALSKARSIADVAAVVRSFARRLVDADGASFILREGELCHYVDDDAIGPLWKGQRFPLEACVSGWAMLHREAVVIPDVFRDDRVPADVYRPTFVKSLAMVLIGLGGPIGAIGVYWGSPHEATEEEVRLIQTLADASANALEVVRLLEELEARVAERTAELTAANRELEAFSYSVSHDLRAPLRAMDGFSRLLVEEHGPSLDPDAQRLLGVVSASARRMATLIDDLLALSRLGRTEVRIRRVAMAPLVASVLDEALSEEERERWTIDVGDLPDALGDPGLVRQVWANLLGNAVKFSRTRQRPAIEVSASREGKLVAYCLKDNGVGFDMAYAEKLFGVFQRLHPPKEFPGTGVGLAIVSRILSRLGGTASGQGEVGVGATFTFTLPGAEAEA